MPSQLDSSSGSFSNGDLPPSLYKVNVKVSASNSAPGDFAEAESLYHGAEPVL